MGRIESIVFNSREEWLAHRVNGIGASEAGIILGQSPYKTNVELWEEKMGLRVSEDISGKSYVQYGNDAEALLRDLFALDYPEYDVGFTPFKVIFDTDRPYIFATPDGELVERSTGRRGGLEVKTTEILNSTMWLKWKDRIPDLYYAQVLHQMLATGWEYVKLKAQIKHRDKNGEVHLDTRHYHIERIEAMGDIKVVEQEDTLFWNCVKAGKKPNLKLYLP